MEEVKMKKNIEFDRSAVCPYCDGKGLHKYKGKNKVTYHCKKCGNSHGEVK